MHGSRRPLRSRFVTGTAGRQETERSGRTTVGIIGAGLGGLSAALALTQAGFDVEVFEKAPELTEVGGGLSVQPNASRILLSLGLGAALERDGVQPSTQMQRRWDDGRVLNRSPLNPSSQDAYGAPTYTVHRADLQRMLATAFRPGRIHFGHRFVGLTDKGNCVEARFENGEHVTVDVLVGADGIHSEVRGALFGQEPAAFTGCVAYRGLCPIDRIPDPELATGSCVWLGPGAHFGCYPIAAGRLLNFVGWTEHDSWNREDWTDRVPVVNALDSFAGWHEDVPAIIGAADTCFIWALFGRDPLPQWSVGRTTLLGDACHPMHPFMGQGAAQAIEDGVVLATYLAKAGEQEVPDALQRYEALRLPRVTLLQTMSRTNQTILNAPDGPTQIARDAAWAAREGPAPEQMQWLFGFDATKLEDMDHGAVHEWLPGKADQ